MERQRQPLTIFSSDILDCEEPERVHVVSRLFSLEIFFGVAALDGLMFTHGVVLGWMDQKFVPVILRRLRYMGGESCANRLFQFWGP